MQWENLTAPDFAAAVKETQGVCLLPLPCIEKHGGHLPLGTDMFIGMEIARRWNPSSITTVGRGRPA